jgi:hypothetical protein
MARKSRGAGAGRLAVITLLLGAAAIAVWIGIGALENDSTAPAPQPTAEPEVAEEPDLPGEPFAAAGTLLAMPGAPRLPINLLDHPDRSGRVVRVVGQLSPGQGVDVTRRYRNIEEDRFYYRVGSGELAGWVPETLVEVER